MKFKILEIKQVSDNLQVAIFHKDCEREVFGFPINLAKDDKYIEEIKRILSEREKIKKIKINDSLINQEFKID